ncbi:MAG: D-2-hydroxyacid dehydrogenase [Aggregatilineales bacterium]
MDETLNVLVLVDFGEVLMNRLKSLSPRLKFTRSAARTANEIPREVWANTDILYTANVLPEPDQALRLRWIQLHFAGIDAIIDSPVIQNQNVILTTASGIHASTIAEYAFAMMLAHARKIPLMLRYQARAEWAEKRFELVLPRELRGSTLGIVGYGSIGRATARLAKAFGMTVLATKRNVMQPASRNEYEEEGVGDPQGECVDRLYPPEAIRSMVSLCDFVLVTLPLTPQTRGYINASVFEAMQPHAIFLNVGRGGVVDEEALIAALKAGKIGGAALDVFAREPLPQSSPLWAMENVIISPHIAGNTARYNERAVDVFAENLMRYLEKKELLNRVDLSSGY